MDLSLQIILFVLSVGFYGYVFVLTLRKNIEVKHSIPWFVLSLCFVLLCVFPEVLYYVSLAFGIKEKVNALYLIIIALVLLIVFSYSLVVSLHTKTIRVLVQEISMLKHQLEKEQNPKP